MAPPTIWDHIRKRRLQLKMLQNDVAGNSVRAGNYPIPRVQSTSAGGRLGGRLVWHRTSLGMSQKEAALKLGIDPSTFARWERREREPTGKLASRAEQFLAARASSSPTAAPTA